jgi:hypothetical protein
MAQWVSNVPPEQAKQYLLLLLQGKARGAEQQVQREYAMSLRTSLSTPTVPTPQRRPVAELQEVAEQALTERVRVTFFYFDVLKRFRLFQVRHTRNSGW